MTLDIDEQILKCHDDYTPVRFCADNGTTVGTKSFKLKEGSTCSWVKQGEPFGPDKLRSRIEPWLTALFQSEHLSVLVGSGLTHALHRMATDNSLPGMDLATFGSFGNEITAEALKHEWFHLYQKEYHSLSSYTEPGMMEWEQALFRDILMYIKAGGNTESIAYNWACSRTGKEGYRIEYLDWLSTLTNKGTTFPNNIDNSNFEHYADVFGDVSITYNKSRGYNYSNTNYKPTAIQSIFAGAEKHCQ